MEPQKFNFKIEKKLSGTLGRAGTIHTPHGDILTPAFIPVGTKATVKSITTEQLDALGADAYLANTYHLYLQPGDELVKKAGGLHVFSNWQKPMITDSGGFQVFSLGAAFGKEISKVVKVTDPNYMIPEFVPERADDENPPRLAEISRDGVTFKSHLDGSMHYITPEKSVQIQHNLGADIIFAFDECTSPAEDDRYQSDALMRTHAWAKRSLEEHVKLNEERGDSTTGGNDVGVIKKDAYNRTKIALFGIVQGGRNEMLRKESAKAISEMKVGEHSFDGFGIGGSFAKEDMSSAVKWVNEILPEDKPRHLLGIGEPEDLLMGIENGVDMFDCVAPTRNARNGTFYTHEGKINISNAQYKEDLSPIEKNVEGKACGCYTCQNYTRAYLSHLFRAKEMLAATLGTIHNLYFVVNLVKAARQAILDETFVEFRDAFLLQYSKKRTNGLN